MHALALVLENSPAGHMLHEAVATGEYWPAAQSEHDVALTGEY